MANPSTANKLAIVYTVAMLAMASSRPLSRPSTQALKLLKSSSRITNGNQAPSKFRDHFAILVLTFPDETETKCMSTLYHDQWLLTAASCLTRVIGGKEVVANISKSYAVIAPIELRNLSQKRRYALREMHIHANWTMQERNHNVALVKMETPPLNDKGRAVVITEAPPAHTVVMATSYRLRRGRMSRFLLRANFVTLYHEECQDLADDFTVGEEGLFCIVSPNFVKSRRSICDYDVGSPVYVVVDEVPYLFGIVAFTTARVCGSPFGSYWYTRVSAYKDRFDHVVTAGRCSDFNKYV